MKTALYGRIVFGASAVLFGVIALMWHDADTGRRTAGSFDSVATPPPQQRGFAGTLEFRRDLAHDDAAWK